MRIPEALPRRFDELTNVWIPMRDGVHLSARVWVPEGAEDEPVPAVFEYIPYPKNEETEYRDAVAYRYFAGHGYACVRVNLRGSGESEGVLTDEYLPVELEDGIDVLRWIEAQSWSNGRVGMMGISWGGFNGLQIAALQPPQLQAVITLCSTDDRYADDVHYMGGCLLGENLSWASVMFAYNSAPPDPALVGDRWRKLWMERLAGSGLWLEQWLRHQRRDDYWQHGSICEDYDAVQCPVLAISGWADGYSNTVFRLMEHLSVPRKALVGPWSHAYPHFGTPGPAMGFLQEALAWWDQWLKDRDTSVMDEPMVRVWMQDSVPPMSRYDSRPGRWVGEPGWPSPNIRTERLKLAPGRLVAGDTDVAEAALAICSPPTVGLFAGKWCSYPARHDLPHDQREEDGGSLVFDTEPLEASVELLGAPVVELDLSCDREVALIALRLCDVAPDQQSTRISYGILNLTHRGGHDQPRALEPGRRYRIRVQLNELGQRLPAGHRCRLAISTSYWPIAWPPPHAPTVTVYTGAATLSLPVRPPRPAEEAALRIFEEPAGAAAVPATVVEPGRQEWRVVQDLVHNISSLEVVDDEGTRRIEDSAFEITRRAREWYRLRGNDYASASGETHHERCFRRGEWQVRTDTHTEMRADAVNFYVTASLVAFEGDEKVYERRWNVVVPRDFV